MQTVDGMTEEQLEALSEMWASAEKVWGSLRDIAKRCASSEKAWKEAAVSPDWKAGYQKVLGVKEAVGSGIKAAEKIVDLSAKSNKKLAKEKIDTVVKDLKKYDKTIDDVDAAVAQYIVWKRKFEKIIDMKIGAADMDVLALMKNFERYMHDRGVFNKELQSFQRLARA